MAIISIPNEFERLQKPPFWQTQAYGLDWDNEFANIATNVLLLNEGSGTLCKNLAKGGIDATFSGSPVWDRNSVYVSGGAGILLQDATNWARDNFTVVMAITPIGAISDYTAIVDKANLGSSREYSTFISSAGNVNWMSVGVGSGSAVTDGTLYCTSDKYSFIIFSRGVGTTFTAYNNGIITSSNFGASCLGSTEYYDGAYFGANNSGGGSHFTGYINLILTFDAALTDSQCFSLTSNPYQIVYTPRWSHFVDFGGGTPATFNAAWARGSNILIQPGM